MEKLNNNHCIYVHTNLANGKKYVGQTSGSTYVECNENRWKSGKGYEDQPKFYNAIKKYGWDGFKHEILETGLSGDDANQKESYYIGKFDAYDNGYNATVGGAGTRKIKRQLIDIIQESLDNPNQFINAHEASCRCSSRINIVTAFSKEENCNYTIIDFAGWPMVIYWYNDKSVEVVVYVVSKKMSVSMKQVATSVQKALILSGFCFDVESFYAFYDKSEGSSECFRNCIFGKLK